MERENGVLSKEWEKLESSRKHLNPDSHKEEIMVSIPMSNFAGVYLTSGSLVKLNGPLLRILFLNA